MVRYADCPVVEVSVAIAAPAAAVFDLVTDLDLPARYSDEFTGAELLGGASAVAVGVQFRGRNRHAAIGEWETTSTVVECEPPRVFAYAVGDVDEPSAVWRYWLDEDGPGVVLHHSAQMGPAPSGLSIAIAAMPDKEERIVARRLEEFRANMAKTLAGIKQLAETGETGGGR